MAERLPAGATLDERIEFIDRVHPPLEVGRIPIQRPELVGRLAGTAVVYAQGVEDAVDLNLREIGTIQPHLTPTNKRFLEIWYPQEKAHAVGLADIAAQLEMPLDPYDTETVGVKIAYAGRLAEHSRWVEQVLEMLYLNLGAMNETSATLTYRRLQQMFTALGEQELAAFMAAIVGQESAHNGYYRAAGLELKAKLSPLQLHILRLIVEQTTTPVGANDAYRRRQFGRTTLELTAVLDGVRPLDIATVAAPAEKMARDLLLSDSPEQARQLRVRIVGRLARTLLGQAQNDGLPLTGFMRRDMQACVDEFREFERLAA